MSHMTQNVKRGAEAPHGAGFHSLKYQSGSKYMSSDGDSLLWS